MHPSRGDLSSKLQDPATDHIRNVDAALRIDRDPAWDDELAGVDASTAPLCDESPSIVELPDTIRAIVRQVDSPVRVGRESVRVINLAVRAPHAAPSAEESSTRVEHLDPIG